MSGPLLIGAAYEAKVRPGGRELELRRTQDDSRVGVTDLNGRSAEDLRRLADAIDVARGRLPL